MPEKIKLSPSETKIARGLLMGRTHAEIRARHHISPNFYGNAAGSLYKKCGVSVAHQFVAKYYTERLELITRDGFDV